MTVEQEVTNRIAHEERIAKLRERTGGEQMHPDHHDFRQAVPPAAQDGEALIALLAENVKLAALVETLAGACEGVVQFFRDPAEGDDDACDMLDRGHAALSEYTRYKEGSRLVNSVDEQDVAAAIRSGDLRLEHILQNVFETDNLTDRLIEEIEHLGGTHVAGQRAARFALAMQES
ncbi:hypothetical protein D2T29_12410 [Sinirhodobacter populi]|uniref:Uncharacterized protein n=1 Tax=Paenirhodobacter populi TaxID=2306993 RepID=A0A443KCD8_9RHOB|nr:hypothetical protein [Sinirhodobacter populi]RWR30467.1 hypothetical protein D2T29_12410 [Sinirhodobacter populi]